VRVIAGIYRSRVLRAPRGLATRPTTDRLRETLFNVLAPRISGCTFADLFAGSGANGIEALSRGARQVYFVENAAAALAAVRGNLKTLGIDAGFEIEARSVDSFLPTRGEAVKAGAVDGDGNGAGIDVAFLDPPYEDEEAYSVTLNLLGGECASVLAPDGIVVAEHLHKRALLESYGNLMRYRVLKQGDAALSFFSLSDSARA
jgi:16S rRNA (guanine966-N2)-methyltransferase